jgi:hypothetical protein
MKKATRKRKNARRSAVGPAQRLRLAASNFLEQDGAAVADPGLDKILIQRGWTVVDRGDGLTMYDWPPSAPDDDHEITYLIIDLRGVPDVGPPYRVSVVNGDRLMYEVESALVADLDTIEASRCVVCTPCPHGAAR